MPRAEAGRRSWLPIRQAIIAASLATCVLVGISFGRVAVEEYQLNRQEQLLQKDIVNLKRDNADLEARVKYLQTDTAIEMLARDELGWTKPGDTAVVVIVPKSNAPTVEASIALPKPPPPAAASTSWLFRLARSVLGAGSPDR